VRDPGLQGERAAPAWRRTALGALANALILIRAGLVADHSANLARRRSQVGRDRT
jgi:hypothetical protein